MTSLLLRVLLGALCCFPALAAGQDQPSSVPEQAEAPPRPAVVTGNANLRAAPSRRGTILAVAQQGTIVQVLEERGSWYRVRTEAGTEAWTHSSLLVFLQQPPPLQPAAPPAPPSEPAEEIGSAPVTEEQEESGQETRSEQRGEGIRAPAAEEQAALQAEEQVAPTLLPDESARSTSRDLLVYLLAALLVSALAIIGWQRRSVRRFKQTMHEPEQVRPPAPVPESTADIPQLPTQPHTDAETAFVQPDAEMIAQQTAGEPALVHSDRVSPLLPDLPLELSPAERVVVEALAEHGEVPERDLRNILNQRGFRGVLIKAVVGDIVRKTGSDGPPWIRVHYAHGQYTYKLQLREALSGANGLAMPRTPGEHKQG